MPEATRRSCGSGAPPRLPPADRAATCRPRSIAHLACQVRVAVRALSIAAPVLAAPALAAGPPSYRIAVAPGLDSLAVRACFPDRLPERLEPADLDLAIAPRSAVLERGGQSQAVAPGTPLEIPAGDGPGCLAYRVDLPATSGDGWHGLIERVPGALLLSPLLFLRAPPQGLAGAALGFDLRAGMQVSAPWEQAGPGPADYRIGARPLAWDARIAIGDLDRFDLVQPVGRLEVTLLPGDPPARREHIEPWLRANADALARAWAPAAPAFPAGRLPVERLRVLVVPNGRSDEPVPWGEAMRGGGDAVHLYIDQTRPLADFLSDWVLIHELSHLLHPYMQGDGRWLAEGIASYYQNLLPVRAGWRSEQDAFSRLHAGFRRGQKGTRPGQTLRMASESMLKERAFMRVYWSGAAIALLADLQLREESGGTWSLDRALAELRHRDGPFERGWTPDEVIAGLDRASGSRVFSELKARWLDSDRFPDLEPAYRALGIEPLSDTEVRLSPRPRAAALRGRLTGSDGARR